MARVENRRTCRSEAVFNGERHWLQTADFGPGVAPALPRAERWPAFGVALAMRLRGQLTRPVADERWSRCACETRQEGRILRHLFRKGQM